ncbi:MtrAB system accessory lipoprotein LpqB [Gordonia sp. ABSL11-1]|uniref:MtrAB system accessory lipoprotein LpqB n=1 Tax=Gordonia sp. ABSL11-1 TaxID=3053924 RepID=UPI0025743F24|nr:MtrAB system accessory lipoprotein LpqB [Gordonia sp. ABSL11-1]MDL9945003.1 MtrAB system accessory lipoprotein LpqB [Gordonia sp. ABSL11-1]
MSRPDLDAARRHVRSVRARGHSVATTVVLVVLVGVLAACGSIPNSSSPQPITAFARQGPTNAVPVPQRDMDPESLVRAFLKATADPDGGHRAARNFLTTSASEQWDDRGDMLVVDEINVFVDQRSEDAVRLRLIGDNVGTLRSDGQLLPATGRVETSLALTRVGDEWRIDGPLPNGTMIDRNQFDAAYRAVTLYFTDRNLQRLVADPRWLYAGTDTEPTVLINRLIAGQATDLDGSVDSGFPNGAALRGPVTQLSGGGVRIDLTGIGSSSVRDRTALAAQIIWTLDGADIGGPYVINADGGPLIPERASGWQTADVKSFDPTAAPTTDVGLNIIRSGSLLKVTDTGTVPVSGALGSSKSVRSSSISADGRRTAAVIARGGTDPRRDLAIGAYGAEPGPVVTGTTITRPSFGSDADSVWAVVDGKPVQWVREETGASDRLTTVDAASIATVARGAITELQVSPDGVRAALVVGGQVVFAVVSTNAEGAVSLTSPRIAAYNIGNRAVSLDWASPTTLMIARDAPESPVVQLSINGTPAVGLLSGNLSPPVRAIVANQSTVYVGDSRGVLRLGSANGQPDQYWTEVESAMSPGAIPVLP